MVPAGVDLGAPGVGDVSSVLPPGLVTSPAVGPAPSDGPGGVIPPAGAGVGESRVPPLAPSFEHSIGVAPPIGWEPERGGEQTEALMCLEDAAVMPFCGRRQRTEPPRPATNVAGQAGNDQRENAEASGGNQSDSSLREAQASQIVRSVQRYVAREWGSEIAEGSGAPLQIMINVTQGMDPEERAGVFLVIATLIRDRVLSKETLARLGEGIRNQRDTYGEDVARASLGRFANNVAKIYQGNDGAVARAAKAIGLEPVYALPSTSEAADGAVPSATLFAVGAISKMV